MQDVVWLTWWVWGVAALAFIVIEMLAPGFIALGFGIGAGIIAALFFVAPKLVVAPSLLALLFALLSLGAWLVLRRVFALPKGQVKKFDHDIND